MQREIKFRAWDTEKLEMYSPCNPYVSQFIAADIACKLCGNIKREDHPYIFMQYTGLMDKNGVEIYEGDIIKYNTYFYGNTKEVITVVDWSTGTTDLFGQPDFCGYLITRGDCEIAGNIYQNKDLLK